MQHDIAVVIVTVDRSPNPNYLPTTLDNLIRAGVFSSSRLHSFHVVDSGSAHRDGELAWPVGPIKDAFDHHPELQSIAPVLVHNAPTRISAKQNCAGALRAGARSGAQWVLHLEDDLDVVGDFLGSVGRWLDVHDREPRRPLYAFSGDNAFITHTVREGGTSWEYPVSSFWGFQCFAMRPPRANDFANWLEQHPVYVHVDGREDMNAHDLEAHRWAKVRGFDYFRGSCPSFVQHIGNVTSIAGNVMGGKCVTFPSWPGRDWVYGTGEVITIPIPSVNE